MSTHTAPPAPLDGSTGNVLQRTEPKVKAASLAALLTPLALYYLYRYVPGVSGLPHELDAVGGTVVTGVVTFLSGYLARAVDRIDLFGQQAAAEAAAAATAVGERTVGAAATETIEEWTERIGGKFVRPLERAAQAAAHAVVDVAEGAAAAGEDPVAAVRAELPAALGSLEQAVSAGRAEAVTSVQAAARAVPAVDDLPAAATVEQAVQAAVGDPAAARDQLVAELTRLLGRLQDPEATPIGDAAAAIAVPAPVGPVTAEIPVVTVPPAPTVVVSPGTATG